jgi:hypothetical protein
MFLKILAFKQLWKVLKWQIQNNDVSSIQLKLWTQIDVDVEVTLEKVPINGNHVHIQVCNFKTLKKLSLKPFYNRNHRKNVQFFWDKGCQNQMWSHHPKGNMQVHHMMCP